MSRNATREEVAARVRSVAERILQGEPSTAIVADTSSAWEVGERQAWKYVKRARKQLETHAAELDELSFSFHVGKRLEIMRKAEAVGEYRIVLDTLKDLAKIQNLYSVDRAAAAIADGAQAQLRALLVAITAEPEEPSS